VIQNGTLIRPMYGDPTLSRKSGKRITLNLPAEQADKKTKDAMNPKTHFRRLNIALLLSDKSVPQIISEAEHYVLRIQGNSYFPKPSPDLQSISAQIAVLEQAYYLSLTRVRGSVSGMHTELQKLCVLVTGLAGYVQTIANQDPEHAALIINSSGMQIKQLAPSPRRLFRVRRGKYSNSILLDSRAIKRAAVAYQMTKTPQIPSSWEYIYFGTKVKFEIEGLDPNAEYFFRMANSIRGEMTAWSSMESIFTQ
jgi:hypothetical protein